MIKVGKDFFAKLNPPSEIQKMVKNAAQIRFSRVLAKWFSCPPPFSPLDSEFSKEIFSHLNYTVSLSIRTIAKQFGRTRQSLIINFCSPTPARFDRFSTQRFDYQHEHN